MLDRLPSGFDGKLTSSKWAWLTGTSPDTVLRDITDLVDRGILRRDPAGGRSTSYSLLARRRLRGYPVAVATSERDLEYLRRLGEYKRQSHDAAQREHLALSLDDRLRRGWALSLAADKTGALREDDPTPFYDRARALGLYIP